MIIIDWLHAVPSSHTGHSCVGVAHPALCSCSSSSWWCVRCCRPSDSGFDELEHGQYFRLFFLLLLLFKLLEAVDPLQDGKVASLFFPSLGDGHVFSLRSSSSWFFLRYSLVEDFGSRCPSICKHRWCLRREGCGCNLFPEVLIDLLICSRFYPCVFWRC